MLFNLKGVVVLCILFFVLVSAGATINGVLGGLAGLVIGGGLIVLHGELKDMRAEKIKRLIDQGEHENGLPFIVRPKP